MAPSDQSLNPYQSPTTVGERLDGSVRRFQVGPKNQISVFLEASIWTGIGTYATTADGWQTERYRGPCELQVEADELHHIQVRVDEHGRVNLHVDGELVEENVFASLRSRIYFGVAVFSLLLMAFTFYLAYSMFLTD